MAMHLVFCTTKHEVATWTGGTSITTAVAARKWRGMVVEQKTCVLILAATIFTRERLNSSAAALCFRVKFLHRNGVGIGQEPMGVLFFDGLVFRNCRLQTRELTHR